MTFEPSPERTTAPRIFTPEYYARMRELERGAWWNAGMRDIATQLLGLASLPPTGRLLDVGCGSGQTMDWFGASHPAWERFGLDLSGDGLRAAHARGLATVLQGSALMLPVASASVDLVLSLDLLQHLPLGGGDVQALAEMARVLKPAGHLFLRTNAQTLLHVPDDPAFNFHKYRPAELREKLAAAGLDVIRLGRVNALLGLAELPADLRTSRGANSYDGLRAKPRSSPDRLWSAKRRLLRLEGRAVRYGLSWPMGRTLVALCKRSPEN